MSDFLEHHSTPALIFIADGKNVLKKMTLKVLCICSYICLKVSQIYSYDYPNDSSTPSNIFKSLSIKIEHYSIPLDYN